MKCKNKGCKARRRIGWPCCTKCCIDLNLMDSPKKKKPNLEQMVAHNAGRTEALKEVVRFFKDHGEKHRAYFPRTKGTLNDNPILACLYFGLAEEIRSKWFEDLSEETKNG